MADEAIDKLKSKHEDVIIKAGDQGWDKATNPAADQICGLKDIILWAGYDMGLDNASIPNDHELYNRTTLCPLWAFTVVVMNPGEAHVADEENVNVGNEPQ